MAKKSGNYVEGFVLAVPKKNIQKYRRLATKAGKIWMEYGALEFRECAADDLSQKGPTTFPKIIKAKSNETVFFSYIVYKSKADRKKIMAKVMKDPRLADMMDPKNIPFDMNRMAYGGFKPVVKM